MADIKPIGSEKMDGMDKIKRIMEIARYNEVLPENSKDLSSLSYEINFRDGNQFGIIKERQGYIIKKMVSENTSEYIEPIKNRRYFSSYSQALKKLNLMIKENNQLLGSEKEISLFGEQKKFVLKTPKPAAEAGEEVPNPPTPEPLPSPDLPPAPGASPAPDMDIPMDTEAGGMPEDMGAEVDMPPMPDEGDTGDEKTLGHEMGGEVTFNTIQKLTGKLTQKIREFSSETEMSSEDTKYVINMILSAVNLENLSDEDKEEIMSKFEPEDLGGDDMDGEDLTDDSEVEKIQSDMDVENDANMVDAGANPEGKMEAQESMNIFDHLFSESKVDKILTNYFEITESEVKGIMEKTKMKKIARKKKIKESKDEIERLSETIEQQLTAQKFIEENPKFSLIGKTNKRNLVFENFNKKVKITPDGFVI